MPAVMPNPAAEKAAEAAGQIAQAGAKVRMHDVAFGGLLLGLTVLAYLTVMILLDRWLVLPSWIRQTAWLLVAAAVAFIGYRFLVVPYRRAVNPLYTAKLVEQSLPDAKNAVVNWVDLQDKPLPESVRDAVSARAARQLAGADLARAVESRGIVLIGSGVAALVVALAVLFLVFKPMVFTSLAGRAIFPFGSESIATRTAIELINPVGGNAELIAGEPLPIAVRVSGREPDRAAADRMRVLIRRHEADEQADEVPLEPLGNREWGTRLPPHLIQNGMLYRIAGGDAQTAEYAVKVRPRAVFTDFKIQYDYPTYLNMLPETSTDPHIEAFRGTVVTITAAANRELRDGRMIVKDAPAPIPGEIAGNTMTVRFTLMEHGTYQLAFTATSGETSTDSPSYLLRVFTDQPPTVEFAPTQPEAGNLPVNGLLTVDGRATDDFGIDRMSLKLRVQNGAMLAERVYRDGMSFRREIDNTWPTEVDYKDSVRISELTLETGGPANLKAGDVIEYWLEAADNCTVPGPNIGRSPVYSVKLEPEPVEPDARQQQQAADKQRKEQEAQHDRAADQQRQQEKRDPKQGPQSQRSPKPDEPSKPEESQQLAEQPGEAKPGTQPEQPKPEAKDPTEPKQPAEQAQPGEPKADQQPAEPGKAEAGGEEEAQRKAEQVQKAIEELNQQPGSGKSGEQPTSGEPPPVEASQKPTPSPDQQSAADQKPAATQEPSGEPSEERDPQPEQSLAEPQSKPSQQEEPNASAERQPPDAGQQAQAGSEKSTPQQGPQEQPGTARPEGTTEDRTSQSKDAGKQEPGKEKGTPQQGDQAGGAKDRSPAPAAEQKPASTETASEASDPKSPQNEQAAGQASSEKSGGDPPAGQQQARGTERSSEQPAAGDQRPTPEQVANAARDLNSKDPAKQQQARETLDRAVGEDARKQAEQLMNDLKSDNAEKRQAAQDKLKDIQKQLAENQKSGQPTPEQMKQAEELAKDMASPDPAKREAAREQIEKMAGEDARKQAEQLAKDLQSEDAATRQAAEQKLDDIKKQAEQMAKDRPGQPSPEEVAQAAKDLNSKDPEKQAQARKTLDQAMGEDARKQAEQLAKDLQSEDAATRQAAENKLNEMKKQAEQMAKNQPPGKPTPEQMKQAEQLAKDLQSEDAATREAAEKKLDEMIGEDARKQAEQLAKDLKSEDAATREKAEQKLNELKNQMEQIAKDQPPGKPSSEQMKRLEDLAKDLNSTSPEKRQAAEKALDDMLGKDQRNELQDQMKGEQPGEPLPQSVQDRLQQLAKEGKLPQDPRSGGPPSAGRTGEAQPIDPDSGFDKLAGQRQLETFKKERANEELLKKLGWTQEDYDRFVRGYEEMLKRGVDPAAEPGTPAARAGVPTVNTSGATRVEPRTGPATGSPQAAGTAFAPPGYTEAQNRFKKEAMKAAEKNKQ